MRQLIILPTSQAAPKRRGQLSSCVGSPQVPSTHLTMPDTTIDDKTAKIRRVSASVSVFSRVGGGSIPKHPKTMAPTKGKAKNASALALNRRRNLWYQ